MTAPKKQTVPCSGCGVEPRIRAHDGSVVCRTVGCVNIRVYSSLGSWKSGQKMMGRNPYPRKKKEARPG